MPRNQIHFIPLPPEMEERIRRIQEEMERNILGRLYMPTVTDVPRIIIDDPLAQEAAQGTPDLTERENGQEAPGENVEPITPRPPADITPKMLLVRRTCAVCRKRHSATVRNPASFAPAYCSPECERTAMHRRFCPVCSGVGRLGQGRECGECFGSGWVMCAACGEAPARADHAFLLTGRSGVYMVCEECAPLEVEAGAESVDM